MPRQEIHSLQIWKQGFYNLQIFVAQPGIEPDLSTTRPTCKPLDHSSPRVTDARHRRYFPPGYLLVYIDLDIDIYIYIYIYGIYMEYIYIYIWNIYIYMKGE